MHCLFSKVDNVMRELENILFHFVCDVKTCLLPCVGWKSLKTLTTEWRDRQQHTSKIVGVWFILQSGQMEHLALFPPKPASLALLFETPPPCDLQDAPRPVEVNYAEELFEETVNNIKITTIHLLRIAWQKYPKHYVMAFKTNHPNELQNNCSLSSPKFF